MWGKKFSLVAIHNRENEQPNSTSEAERLCGRAKRVVGDKAANAFKTSNRALRRVWTQSGRPQRCNDF